MLPAEMGSCSCSNNKPEQTNEDKKRKTNSEMIVNLEYEQLNVLFAPAELWL